MNPRSPLGVIRLLAPISGRLVRLGRKLVPMTWRRRRRQACAPTTLLRGEPATYVATNLYLSCNFSWPTGASLKQLAESTIERTRQPIFRLDRIAAKAGFSRLRMLIEKLWRERTATEAKGTPIRGAVSWPVGVIDEFRSPRLRHVRNAASAEATAAKPACIKPDWQGAKGRRARPTVHEFAQRDSGLKLKTVFRRSGPRRLRTTWLNSQASGSFPIQQPAGHRTAKEKHQLPAPGAAAAARHWGKSALIWRSPPALSRSPAIDSKPIGPTPAKWQSVTDPAQPVAALQPVAPAQAPDFCRLVDEVVRRIERIGRDERMRRGG